MVFSDKHQILTKKLYQLKGYNARQLRTEFPNKGWMTSSINRLLKKFMLSLLLSALCPPAPLKSLTSWRYTNQIIIIMVAPWNRADHYIFILFMVALRNRADHYIFMLFLLSFFISSPNLSGQRLDVYHTSTHGVALVRI